MRTRTLLVLLGASLGAAAGAAEPPAREELVVRAPAREPLRLDEALSVDRMKLTIAAEPIRIEPPAVKLPAPADPAAAASEPVAARGEPRPKG